MKLKEFIKIAIVSLLIAVVISVVNFYFTKDPFIWRSQAIIYAINFMFAVTITALNSWYFKYIDKFFTWSAQPAYRFTLGAVGSVVLTMAALFVLQGITSMVFFGNSWEKFISNQSKYIYLIGILLTLVVSVIFHAVYFYKELQSKKMQEQRVIASSATAQFDALKNQLDPHFLFNSLNVLVALIEENPDAAVSFTTSLSKVYRYVLEQRNKALVPVDEELDFARTYVNLLNMRFEDSMQVSIPERAINKEQHVVPLSLQLLIENAVKHNELSGHKPLKLRIYEDGDALVVENNLQVKNVVKSSSGLGLQNIAQRYALLSDRKMTVNKTSSHFIVHVPLLQEPDLTIHLNLKDMTTVEEFKMINAREQVAELKEFYHSCIKTAVIISFLAAINYLTSGFPWVLFPLAGMGLSLLYKYLKIADSNMVLGRRWEQNKIASLMNNPKF